MLTEKGILVLGANRIPFKVFVDEELEEGKIILNPNDIIKLTVVPEWSEKDLEKINSIKGIGKETLSDIKKAFNSLDNLIIALKEDRVPFRNDVVKKLKKLIG